MATLSKDGGRRHPVGTRRRGWLKGRQAQATTAAGTPRGIPARKHQEQSDMGSRAEAEQQEVGGVLNDTDLPDPDLQFQDIFRLFKDPLGPVFSISPMKVASTLKVAR